MIRYRLDKLYQILKYYLTTAKPNFKLYDFRDFSNKRGRIVLAYSYEDAIERLNKSIREYPDLVVHEIIFDDNGVELSMREHNGAYVAGKSKRNAESN